MTATALNQTTAFCEDTRVKIPAIIQFMRPRSQVKANDWQSLGSFFSHYS